MRAAPVLLVSALAHAAVLGWLTERPRPQRVVEVVRDNVFRDAEPIEVAFVLIDEKPTAKTPSTPTSDSPRDQPGGRTRNRVTIHQAARSAVGFGPGELGDSAVKPSAGRSLLRMRGVELSLDPSTAERIANAGRTAPRDEVRESGKLRRQPGGRAVVHDTVTTLTVDADGKAKFHDKPDLDAQVNTGVTSLLAPEVRKEVRDHVAKWIADPYEGTRYRPSHDLPRHLQAVSGACDVWGSDLCQEFAAPDFEKRVRSIDQRRTVGISGTLDITAYLQRKLIGDPYASRKLKLLDDTRDERVEMGSAYRKQQSARSSEFMQRNVERLWASVPDPVARRAALFELWDECGEDEAGVRARAIVIGWIRARIPRGSERAFSDEEIATLHERRSSTQPFVPYESEANPDLMNAMSR